MDGQTAFGTNYRRMDGGMDGPEDVDRYVHRQSDGWTDVLTDVNSVKLSYIGFDMHY